MVQTGPVLQRNWHGEGLFCHPLGCALPPQGNACSVGLRDTMCFLRKPASPFPTGMSPAPPASIHPRAAGEPEYRGYPCSTPTVWQLQLPIAMTVSRAAEKGLQRVHNARKVPGEGLRREDSLLNHNLTHRTHDNCSGLELNTGKRYLYI